MGVKKRDIQDPGRPVSCMISIPASWKSVLLNASTCWMESHCVFHLRLGLGDPQNETIYSRLPNYCFSTVYHCTHCRTGQNDL